MSDIQKDIRWKQRFSNYRKAFLQLERFSAKKTLNELEEQGLIQAFEYTYELAWKTLQDFFKDRGYQETVGPRLVIELAISTGVVKNGDVWMRIFKHRNLSTHTYDEKTAQELIMSIRAEYVSAFKQLVDLLEKQFHDK